MQLRAMRSVPAYVPDALTASLVGTWETHVEDGYILADAVSAAIFGLDADAAATGLPISHYQDRVHTEDRATTLQRYARMREQGGLYVFEYRTVPRRGEVRWALVRGLYARDRDTGVMVGRGIIIDITASKRDGHVEDRAFFAEVARAPDETPLDRAAALAVEARRAIDAMGERGEPTLRQAVDGLLWAVGRALARRT